MKGKLTSEISQEEFAQIKMFAESCGFTVYINPTGNPKFSKLGNYGNIVVCYCHIFQTIDLNAPREQKEASVKWELENETSVRLFEDVKEFSNDLANAVIIAGMLKNTEGDK